MSFCGAHSQQENRIPASRMLSTNRHPAAALMIPSLLGGNLKFI
jgi:hypothetical protein